MELARLSIDVALRCVTRLLYEPPELIFVHANSLYQVADDHQYGVFPVPGQGWPAENDACASGSESSYGRVLTRSSGSKRRCPDIVGGCRISPDGALEARFTAADLPRDDLAGPWRALVEVADPDVPVPFDLCDSPRRLRNVGAMARSYPAAFSQNEIG
jgi:hypothetical protein